MTSDIARFDNNSRTSASQTADISADVVISGGITFWIGSELKSIVRPSRTTSKTHWSDVTESQRAAKFVSLDALLDAQTEQKSDEVPSEVLGLFYKDLNV